MSGKHALLVADVRGEPLPELVHAGQVQLAPRPGGPSLADPDVIGEHRHDGRSTELPVFHRSQMPSNPREWPPVASETYAVARGFLARRLRAPGEAL